MQVKADVGAVGDEDALASVGQTLLLQGGQFLEEAGDMHDGAGADQVDALGGDEARGEDVEVVGDVFVDDGVAGVCLGKSRLTPAWISFAYRWWHELTVTTSGTSAESSLLRQHVCNLPLSYISSASFLHFPCKPH